MSACLLMLSAMISWKSFAEWILKLLTQNLLLQVVCPVSWPQTIIIYFRKNFMLLMAEELGVN